MGICPDTDIDPNFLGPVYIEVGEPQVGKVTRLAVVEKYNAFTCIL